MVLIKFRRTLKVSDAAGRSPQASGKLFRLAADLMCSAKQSKKRVSKEEERKWKRMRLHMMEKN